MAHTTQKICYFLTLCVLVAATMVFILPGQSVAAESNNNCPITIDEPTDIFNFALNDQITFSTFSVDVGNTASIIVTNNTNCNFPVSLGSYEVYNQVYSDQKLYDSQNKVVPAQSSQLLHVDLPSCMSQIDLLHDPNRDGPPEPPIAANPKLIGWTFQLNNKDVTKENDIFHFSEASPYNELDQFPNDDDDGYSSVPEENRCTNTPPLTFNCSVSPDTPKTGETVTWKAENVSGGDGNYTYQWTKDVSGTNKVENATYSTTGKKTGKITVETTSQKRSAECSVTISDNSGGGSGDFSISGEQDSMWTISGVSLPSTETTINLSKTGGFSQPVTLTASSSHVTNNETKFIHDGGTPQKTLTLSPSEFSDSIKLFSEANVDPATYPVTITAQSSNGMSASAITPLRARSFMEF